MSRYETTNAQYCQFLNAALASGDIYVSSNIVYGASGSNIGGDFVGQVYCETFASDSYSQIVYSGGSFSVRTRDGLDTNGQPAVYDMNDHPVVMVTWYGATAFCNYYGYQLPTEWEWQAVADYDGSYTYGCGTTIDHNKANYDLANPLGLSSPPYTSLVNHYPSYGYGMNDMAGGVWEWTSSLWDPQYDYRVLRGGSLASNGNVCMVSSRIFNNPYGTATFSGFRVCR
jgi:formylglycine-generating enzyme required for sulfatase activity